MITRVESPGIAQSSYKRFAWEIQLLSLALIYGAVLASLPVDVFSDRPNYLVYAERSWRFLEQRWAISPLVGIFNEPVWLLINSGLARFFSPETTVRIIVLVPACVVAWHVLRREPGQLGWLILFLLLPQVVKWHITGLRQGVAIAVFLTGWFTPHRRLRWVLIGISPFIHASFFFLLALLGLAKVGQRLQLAADLRTLLYLGAGIAVGLTLAAIATLLGARQATSYAFAMTDVSGLGFVAWSAVLLLMFLQGGAYVREHTFEVAVIVFYLATYFLLEVTARIFESGILLVLLAGLRLTGWRRVAFLSLITTYALVQYAARLGQPWLGFGNL